MDLYRTLRVSLYLLAGTGALAISVAEQSLFYLVLIAALAGLSCLLIDRGKLKPLSAEITAVLTLVLLYLTLRPLRDDEHWQVHFPAAVAHFLCAWQGLLFFSVYSGPILLTFCGSTLAIVVMSGVVQSGPSLVVRVACFIGVAVWTLYIHAVWRARQEFAGLSTILNTLEDKQPAEGPLLERLRRLPEGSFWGTVGLVAGLSAACMALGVFIFLSAPRIEGLLSLFERRGSSVERKNDFAVIAAGEDPTGAVLTGDSDSVNLRVGRISNDSRAALKVTFTKPLAPLVAAKGRVLLKGHTFATYSNARWLPEEPTRTLKSEGGAPISIADPSLDGPIRVQREEWSQTVEVVGLHTRSLYAAGPIVRVGGNMRRVEVDAEGSLRSAESGALERYTLAVDAPFDSGALRASAVADHRAIQRYIRQNGLSPAEYERVLLLARKITRDIRSDPEKALAIQRWLETNRSYSLNLEQLRPIGDPLAHFLLSNDPQQARGHCAFFASGFVLLCRLNNMPARLCTGFAARTESSDYPLATSIVAYNSDAHAWAEVYYKGIGWVAYDPTPAAPAQERTPDLIVAQAAKPVQTEKPAAVAATGDTGDDTAGVVDGLWDKLLKFDTREQRKLFEKLSGSQSSGGGGLLTGRGYGGWIGAALAWLGIALAIGWLAQLFARRGSRRRYVSLAGAGRTHAAVAFYNDLLAALSRHGYSRQPGQTPREFAASVLRRGGEAFAPVREVTEIFEAVRYGGDDLAQDEFNRLQDALDRIKEMTF